MSEKDDNELNLNLAAMGLDPPPPVVPPIAANPIPVPEPAAFGAVGTFGFVAENPIPGANLNHQDNNPVPAPGAEMAAIGLDKLPELREGVMSDDIELQITCTRQIRKLLSREKNPPIKEVIDLNVGFRLVEFLKFDANPTLQFEASWALTNICSGTAQDTLAVIQWGALAPLVKLLSSPAEDCCEQAMWALGNIAGDSPKSRNIVLEANAMTPLLDKLASNPKLSILRNGVWFLSNLCRGKPKAPFELISPCLQLLSNLICGHDDEVLTDACWAYSYLSDGPNDHIESVISSGATTRLVELLMHGSHAVKTPALRTVGNLVTGDDIQTQHVINCGALPSLSALLISPRNGIRKEACWALSNITSGNRAQIQAVIDANIVPKLIHVLENDQFEVKKEACWAISNLTSGGTAL
jgi:importin subunit alpha-1